MATGSFAAIASYNGTGTQGLAVLDKVDDEDEEVISVFWNKTDTDKQILHGSNLLEIPTSTSTKQGTWGGSQTFSVNRDIDCIGDIYLALNVDFNIPDLDIIEDSYPRTITTLLQKPSDPNHEFLNNTQPVGYSIRGIKEGETEPKSSIIGYQQGFKRDESISYDSNGIPSAYSQNGYPNRGDGDDEHWIELPAQRKTLKGLRTYYDTNPLTGEEPNELVNTGIISKSDSVHMTTVDSQVNQPHDNSGNILEGFNNWINTSLIKTANDNHLSAKVTDGPPPGRFPGVLTEEDANIIKHTGNEFLALDGNGEFEIYTSEGVVASDLFKSYLNKNDTIDLVNYYNDKTTRSHPLETLNQTTGLQDGEVKSITSNSFSVNDQPNGHTDFNGECVVISEDGNTMAVGQGFTISRDGLVTAGVKDVAANMPWNTIPASQPPHWTHDNIVHGVPIGHYMKRPDNLSIDDTIRHIGKIRVYKKKKGIWVLSGVLHPPKSTFTPPKRPGINDTIVPGPQNGFANGNTIFTDPSANGMTLEWTGKNHHSSVVNPDLSANTPADLNAESTNFAGFTQGGLHGFTNNKYISINADGTRIVVAESNKNSGAPYNGWSGTFDYTETHGWKFINEGYVGRYSRADMDYKGIPGAWDVSLSGDGNSLASLDLRALSGNTINNSHACAPIELIDYKTWKLGGTSDLDKILPGDYDLIDEYRYFPYGGNVYFMSGIPSQENPETAHNWKWAWFISEYGRRHRWDSIYDINRNGGLKTHSLSKSWARASLERILDSKTVPFSDFIKMRPRIGHRILQAPEETTLSEFMLANTGAGGYHPLPYGVNYPRDIKASNSGYMNSINFKKNGINPSNPYEPSLSNTEEFDTIRNSINIENQTNSSGTTFGEATIPFNHYSYFKEARFPGGNSDAYKPHPCNVWIRYWDPTNHGPNQDNIGGIGYNDSDRINGWINHKVNYIKDLGLFGRGDKDIWHQYIYRKMLNFDEALKEHYNQFISQGGSNGYTGPIHGSTSSPLGEGYSLPRDASSGANVFDYQIIPLYSDEDPENGYYGTINGWPTKTDVHAMPVNPAYAFNRMSEYQVGTWDPNNGGHYLLQNLDFKLPEIINLYIRNTYIAGEPERWAAKAVKMSSDGNRIVYITDAPTPVDRRSLPLETYSTASGAVGNIIGMGVQITDNPSWPTPANCEVRVIEKNSEGNWVYMNHSSGDMYSGLTVPAGHEAIDMTMSSDGNTVAVYSKRPNLYPRWAWEDVRRIENGKSLELDIDYSYSVSATEYNKHNVNIDGESPGDNFGYSVSLSTDGNSFIAGAPNNSSSQGHARVYVREFLTWNYNDDIDGVAVGDMAGTSVSISSAGNRIAVGSPGFDGGKGHIRVFQKGGGTLGQVGYSTGWALLTDIYPTHWLEQANAPSGTYNAATLATALNNLHIEGTGSSDAVGTALSMNKYGTLIVSGEPYLNQIRIFREAFIKLGGGNPIPSVDDRREGDGTLWWDPLITINNNSPSSWWSGGVSGINSGDGFGSAVAVNSTAVTSAVAGLTHGGFLPSPIYVIVGSPLSSSNVTNSGKVQVLEIISVTQTNYTMSQVGTDIYGESAGAKAGQSVGISADGQTIIIGAPYDDLGGTISGAGRVRVYNFVTSTNPNWTGVDQWVMKWEYLGTTVNENVGASVTISDDANIISFGASGELQTGNIRIYKRMNEFTDSVIIFNKVGDDILGESGGDLIGASNNISASGNGEIIVAGSDDNYVSSYKKIDRAFLNSQFFDGAPFEVTFDVNSSGLLKFIIDGVESPTLNFIHGNLYVFIWPIDHPIRFSITPDGIHNQGTEYIPIDGVNVTSNSSGGIYTGTDPILGIPQANTGFGHTIIRAAKSMPTLYYYNENQSGMGNRISFQRAVPWIEPMPEDGYSIYNSYINDGLNDISRGVGEPAITIHNIVDGAWTKIGNTIYPEGYHDTGFRHRSVIGDPIAGSESPVFESPLDFIDTHWKYPRMKYSLDLNLDGSRLVIGAPMNIPKDSGPKTIEYNVVIDSSILNTDDSSVINYLFRINDKLQPNLELVKLNTYKFKGTPLLQNTQSFKVLLTPHLPSEVPPSTPGWDPIIYGSLIQGHPVLDDWPESLSGPNSPWPYVVTSDNVFDSDHAWSIKTGDGHSNFRFSTNYFDLTKLEDAGMNFASEKPVLYHPHGLWEGTFITGEFNKRTIVYLLTKDGLADQSYSGFYRRPIILTSWDFLGQGEGIAPRSPYNTSTDFGPWKLYKKVYEPGIYEYEFNWMYAYHFYQESETLPVHPDPIIRFSTTPNGIHNSGVEYTNGVTIDFENNITTIEVSEDTPTLYYYSSQNNRMDGRVTILERAAKNSSDYYRTFNGVDEYIVPCGEVLVYDKTLDNTYILKNIISEDKKHDKSNYSTKIVTDLTGNNIPYSNIDSNGDILPHSPYTEGTTTIKTSIEYIGNGQDSGYRFGSSVSISGDGNTISIGAPETGIQTVDGNEIISGTSNITDAFTYIATPAPTPGPKKNANEKFANMLDVFNLINNAQKRSNYDITDFSNLPDIGNPISWKKQFKEVPEGAVLPPELDEYDNPHWADSNLKSKVTFPLSRIIKRIEFKVGTQIWQLLEHDDILAINATELSESAYRRSGLQSYGFLRGDGTRESTKNDNWIPGKSYQAVIHLPLLTKTVGGQLENFTQNTEDGFLSFLAKEQEVKIRIFYSNFEDIWDVNNVHATKGFTAPIYNLENKQRGVGQYITNAPYSWNPNAILTSKLFGKHFIMTKNEKEYFNNISKKRTTGGLGGLGAKLTANGIIPKRVKTSQSINKIFPSELYPDNKIIIDLDNFSLYCSHLIITSNFPSFSDKTKIPVLKNAELFLNSKSFSGVMDASILKGITNKSLGLYSNEFTIDNLNIAPGNEYYVFPLASKAFSGSSILLDRFDNIRLELTYNAPGLTQSGINISKKASINVTCRGEILVTYKDGISTVKLY